MLNFLALTSGLDTTFSEFQAVRFFSNPKRSYEEAVNRIGMFLKRIKDKVMIYCFDTKKPIETFFDADFSGSWNLIESNALTSILSHCGCIIKIANCSAHRISKMQRR